MDFKISKINHEDLDDLMEVNNLSFNIPWSKESFEAEINNKLAHYFVAHVDDKAIGFGGMWLIIDEGHITNIAVHPDYRGSSIGDSILKTMLDYCISKNITAITLEVRASNTIAQNLYTKHGFVTEGIRKKYYEDNSEDAILMWRRW
ncbi:ribosomal-protein-alanine N-acetyltransferase [Clostridium cavendishii DSM 21758]|uniref:[Ribosomal protein bS18]-alanine N-acetyltransferase n=1 Tax=Clostridium cavendishii DSM 21758 TaxID=1121302 RepID=A0A1M6UET5_9CLOT|nr:ribosomal protein S18-alanine N-acetyltransferase [Clostridium cavendishii]SHK67671.1 ribosomal-protein-alanine N-acetyltransferase [Clostridium cavendishii DSM 21758]